MNDNPTPTIQDMPQPSQQSKADTPATRPNQLARVGFAFSLAAQILYVISAIIEWRTGVVTGIVSGALAFIGMVTGIIALRRRPRNLAVAAIVLGGVIVLIFVIIIVGAIYLKDIVAATPTP